MPAMQHYAFVRGPRGVVNATITSLGWPDVAGLDQILDPLIRWAVSLRFIAQHQGIAFAYSCFRIQDAPHVCLATVFPNFVQRGYVLVHVRALKSYDPLDPNANLQPNENDLHIKTLVDYTCAVNAVDINSLNGQDIQARFATYRSLYISQNNIDCFPPHPADLMVERNAGRLQKVLMAAYKTFRIDAAGNKNGQGNAVDDRYDLVLNRPSACELITTLAICAGALPPRLRLFFYWGYGVTTDVRHQALVNWHPTEFPQANQQIANYVTTITNNAANLPAKATTWDIKAWGQLL